MDDLITAQPIRAALLDEGGRFVRIDSLESADALTPRHLPQITECDLPAGQYLWVAEPSVREDGALANPYGGSFWCLAWLRRAAEDRDRACSVEQTIGRIEPRWRNADLTAAIARLREIER